VASPPVVHHDWTSIFVVPAAQAAAASVGPALPGAVDAPPHAAVDLVDRHARSSSSDPVSRNAARCA
jgi:hypothetical protein